jgi:hypothetical protein
MSFLSYWLGTIGKPLLLGFPIGIATLLMRNRIEPRSLFLLLLEFAIIFLIYELSSWFVILSREERTRLLRVFRPAPAPEIGQ